MNWGVFVYFVTIYKNRTTHSHFVQPCKRKAELYSVNFIISRNSTLESRHGCINVSISQFDYNEHNYKAFIIHVLHIAL